MNNQGLDDFLSDADITYELVGKYNGEVVVKKTSRYIVDVLEKAQAIEQQTINEAEEDFRSAASEAYEV